MTDDTTELRQRVDRLERRVGELERLLDEQDANHASPQRDALDVRDAAVVAVLEHGETYTANDLRDLYVRESGIAPDGTLRPGVRETINNRVGSLLEQDFFQRADVGHTYRG